MLVVVTKNKHTHDCTSEEQLQRFLAAGWVKARKQPKDNPKEGEAEGTITGDPEGSAEGEE